MNIRRILVPVDFSDCSNAALEYGLEIAKARGATVYIFHADSVLDVNPVHRPATDRQYDAPWGHERHEIRERLNNIVPEAADVSYKHIYTTGPPVARILHFAEQEKIDLIVVGSHGRKGLTHLLMGSVAEGVMRKAKCPVLVVKNPTACETA
jgi:nucleotide-binding universal stress UspA family protein